MIHFFKKRKLTIFFFLVLNIMLALSVAFLMWVQQKKLETIETISVTYNSLISLEKINLGLHQANSHKNGFILTGFEFYHDSYKRKAKEIPVTLADFSALNPDKKNPITSFQLIVEKNISEMNNILQNREVAGLEILKNAMNQGNKNGIFREFELKKQIMKNFSKTILNENLIILRRLNYFFLTGCFFAIVLILADLYFLYLARNKWKLIQTA